MTKVLRNGLGLGIAVGIGLALCAAPPGCAAARSMENPPARPAETLFLQLGRIGLDPARVYQVRGASLERSAVHIALEDGTIAFTQDVMGRVTGAFFEGDGEILLTPPNEVERKSMSVFTGMAILEERFATAYFRFNDDTMTELRPDLRATDNAQEFIARWGDTAHNLAQADAMRLLLSFSRGLPVVASSSPDTTRITESGDRMLHARLQGTKLGIFDVYFDSTAAEQVVVGQARTVESGVTYYDVWTSFAPTATSQAQDVLEQSSESESPRPRTDSIAVRRYEIAVEVKPPKQIHAEARLQLDVRRDEERTLLFELSRFLQVDSVEMNGQPVEFIHNPAIEGTQLSRRGNDLVAVILPEPAHSGQKIELRFVYSGEVLAEAVRDMVEAELRNHRGGFRLAAALVQALIELQYGQEVLPHGELAKD